MLQCVECGLMGTIEEPLEGGVVRGVPRFVETISLVGRRQGGSKQIAPFRVIRAIESPECPCPREAALPEKHGYERVPGGIWEHNETLSDDVRAELIDLADFVGGSELCSHLLPLFIRSFEADTGQRHSEAMHLIVNRIEKFDLKGLHCSPAVVAKIIRDFAEYHVP